MKKLLLALLLLCVSLLAQQKSALPLLCDESPVIEKYVSNSTVKREVEQNIESYRRGNHKEAIHSLHNFTEKNKRKLRRNYRADLSLLYYLQMEYRRLNQKMHLTGDSRDEVKTSLDIEVKNYKKFMKLSKKVEKYGSSEVLLLSYYSQCLFLEDLAQIINEQPLFGTQYEQTGAQIQITVGIERYYSNAQIFSLYLLEDESIHSYPYLKSLSEIHFMKNAFYKGKLLERVGEIFRDAPPLFPEEEVIYQEEENKYLMALDAALEKYEEGLILGKELNVRHNVWIDSIKARIEYIDPSVETYDLKFD